MTPNTLFPGRPDYTGPTTGCFGLLHHDVLFEWSHDVRERVHYVRNYKPKVEQAIRLWNMIYLDVHLKPLILAYIHKHIPDCPWDGIELVFPGGNYF